MKFLATFQNQKERYVTQLVAASLEDAKFCVEWMEKTYFPDSLVALFEMEVIKCAKLADLPRVPLKKEKE